MKLILEKLMPSFPTSKFSFEVQHFKDLTILAVLIMFWFQKHLLRLSSVLHFETYIQITAVSVWGKFISIESNIKLFHSRIASGNNAKLLPYEDLTDRFFGSNNNFENTKERPKTGGKKNLGPSNDAKVRTSKKIPSKQFHQTEEFAQLQGFQLGKLSGDANSIPWNI